MDTTTRMLQNNRAWAETKLAAQPDYFREMAKDQRPDALWIGCSDARVPAEEITGTTPGQLFVHRNVANLVVHTDLNLMSVLQFAVEHLQVKHVIVCGHYGCGGVKAAMSRRRYGLLNRWLQEIKDTWHTHRDAIDHLTTDEARVNGLVEANVVEQVHNLVKTAIVQEAWRHHQLPVIHGWVYAMSDGLIHPLVTIGPNDPIADAFQYDFDEATGEG